jgi:GTP-binding protein
MPQTRFVLKKALEAHIKPIVVINKIDRANIDIAKTMDEVLTLFIELGAPDEFLDFKVVFTSALQGTSSKDPDVSTQKTGMDAVLQMIIDEIPAPKADVNKPLQLQVSLLDYNDFVGRIGVGTVKNGKIHVNDTVTVARLDGTTKSFKVMKLFGYQATRRVEIEEAVAGEICAVAGLPDINVGETICYPDHVEALPKIHLDEPTLQMTFGTNTSPFAGREGKLLTARKIEERLFRETQKDVALKVQRVPNSETWTVSGRGELHLGILIENMRREGFELEVSKPTVIIKEKDGVKCEPYEDVQIEVGEECVGNVIEALGLRGGKMENMSNVNNLIRLNYIIPSRGLIGFNTDFMTLTKGYGILNHTFREYLPIEDINSTERKLGVLVATEAGKATAYALGQLEDRGVMFIEPGTEVYEGMIVGECNRENDLAVNVVKGKQLTNTRSASKDHTVVLKRPRPITLEYALDYIAFDELVEVTPTSLRMRKRILDANERKKATLKKGIQN